ncbi:MULTISPECIES: TatD family hydrolase [unclassified Nitratiruptor]|uniref:TatD family hydrolase n=1 Tax=unclassified Nitratiruptor TaxID=2624044 RepID=UPI00191573D3|nr:MULTISPECIES: TatD family hydrolase [unclassified Nitratiruptor]BCD60505.1 TatD DNase family protein [Nitratiruptor sp. YY08-10]BCD64006.1 TatD DNase family protein [Nitratiruptor sp. YY08-14]
MIIETHTHLDHQMFQEDVDEVIQRAKEVGVKRFIIPGADPKDLPRAVELAQKYDEVFFAVGVHPYDIDYFDESLFATYATHEKCVAIGECGLDYYRLPKENEDKERIKKQQKEIFIRQIEIANELDLPLIVHIREASNDAKEILEQKSGPRGGVLHCYNASPILLELSDRFYYGIGGVVTFKNAKKLVQILPDIPRNRIVLETDAPYLTPEPYRGKRNEPAYLRFVVQKMAQILDVLPQEIEERTTQNAKKLFHIV